MIAIASVLIVMFVSLLITRVATVALTLTGLSRESARFQARSALSGTGFTTTEAESVVDHPVRRRIVMALMLVGSAGLVTVIATLALSLAGTGGSERLQRLGFLVAGLAAVVALSRSAWFDRRLSWLIARVLHRWTDLDARDYAALLHLSDDYAVGEIALREGDWLAGRTLGELELRSEGVVVLGVTLRNGTWLGSPPFDVRLCDGERLVAYGPVDRLEELDHRAAGPEGDRAHDEAVEAHLATVREVRERAATS